MVVPVVQTLAFISIRYRWPGNAQYRFFTRTYVANFVLLASLIVYRGYAWAACVCAIDISIVRGKSLTMKQNIQWRVRNHTVTRLKVLAILHIVVVSLTISVDITDLLPQMPQSAFPQSSCWIEIDQSICIIVIRCRLAEVFWLKILKQSQSSASCCRPYWASDKRVHSTFLYLWFDSSFILVILHLNDSRNQEQEPSFVQSPFVTRMRSFPWGYEKESLIKTYH